MRLELGDPLIDLYGEITQIETKKPDSTSTFSDTAETYASRVAILLGTHTDIIPRFKAGDWAKLLAKQNYLEFSDRKDISLLREEIEKTNLASNNVWLITNIIGSEIAKRIDKLLYEEEKTA